MAVQSGWGIEHGDYPDDSVWTKLKQVNPLYTVFDEKTFSPNPTPPHASGETAAVCVEVKDDEAYIDEWVDYHRMLGFSKFFIFDRTEQFSMAQWGEEKGDFVQMFHEPGNGAKLNMNGQRALTVSDRIKKKCKELARGDNSLTWMAFLEVQNFVVLKTEHHIMDLLSQYNHQDGIGLFQYRFGTADRRIFEPKPVTQRFQYRDAVIDTKKHNKFVRIKQASFSSAVIFDTDGKKIRRTDQESISTRRPADKAVIHTYTRSKKEYLLKRYGFKALSEEESEDDAEIWKKFGGLLPAGTVFDDSAWQLMKRMNPLYTVYEQLWQ